MAKTPQTYQRQLLDENQRTHFFVFISHQIYPWISEDELLLSFSSNNHFSRSFDLFQQKRLVKIFSIQIHNCYFKTFITNLNQS
jgi:hypothetical protein